MSTLLGRVVSSVLVHGLIAFERIWPMPQRLGVPLDDAARRVRKDPVILVGGYANNSSPGWDEWKRSLEADGFEVFVLEPLSHGLGDMYASARHLADFIASVKQQTGSEKVDVVGFSGGGILTRMAIAYFGQSVNVDQAISLASPHRGVQAGALLDAVAAIPLLGSAIPEATFQLIRGSALLQHLDRSDLDLRLNGPVRYASIHSRVFDLFVTPKSAQLEGAADIAVGHDRPGRHGGPNHFGMYHLSDAAYDAARRLMLGEGPAPIRCARRGAGLVSVRQGRRSRGA